MGKVYVDEAVDVLSNLPDGVSFGSVVWKQAVDPGYAKVRADQFKDGGQALYEYVAAGSPMFDEEVEAFKTVHITTGAYHVVPFDTEGVAVLDEAGNPVVINGDPLLEYNKDLVEKVHRGAFDRVGYAHAEDGRWVSSGRLFHAELCNVLYDTDLGDPGGEDGAEETEDKDEESEVGGGENEPVSDEPASQPVVDEA